MREGKSFSGQVRDPVTELVVTRRDKAAWISVKSTTDEKIGFAAVEVMTEVWGIYAIYQEEGISPFLHTQSVPFTVDRFTISHDPVFVACCSLQAPWTVDPTKVFARASSARRMLRFLTTVLPSRRKAEWSDVRNSYWHLSAATRCPVMTQDAVQFSRDFFCRIREGQSLLFHR